MANVTRIAHNQFSCISITAKKEATMSKFKVGQKVYTNKFKLSPKSAYSRIFYEVGVIKDAFSDCCYVAFPSSSLHSYARGNVTRMVNSSLWTERQERDNLKEYPDYIKRKSDDLSVNTVVEIDFKRASKSGPYKKYVGNKGTVLRVNRNSNNRYIKFEGFSGVWVPKGRLIVFEDEKVEKVIEEVVVPKGNVVSRENILKEIEKIKKETTELLRRSGEYNEQLNFLKKIKVEECPEIQYRSFLIMKSHVNLGVMDGTKLGEWTKEISNAIKEEAKRLNGTV